MMSQQEKDRQPPVYDWEQVLIDDHYDHRWRRVMEPLCEKLQLWKAGQVTHDELDQFMEEVQQQICEVRNLFSQRRDRLVNLIQWWDREWFLEWVKSHSPPAEAVLLEPPELSTES